MKYYLVNASRTLLLVGPQEGFLHFWLIKKKLLTYRSYLWWTLHKFLCRWCNRSHKRSLDPVQHYTKIPGCSYSASVLSPHTSKSNVPGMKSFTPSPHLNTICVKEKRVKNSKRIKDLMCNHTHNRGSWAHS